MKVLGFILQKEFLQIFRDKTILKLMLMLPVIQLIILPLAMNFDVNHINLVVVDNDHSTTSQKLVAKINASGYFRIMAAENSYKQAFHFIESGDADVVLEIPSNFEKTLVREGADKLNVSVDAINGTKSGLGSAYLLSVINDFNSEIRLAFSNGKVISQKGVEVASSVWYNELADYKLYIVPGVLVLLLTLVGGFVSALNIVKEKESGTIEQINVTPLKKWQFIVGKLIPFWIMGMVVLTLGLLVARIGYGIVPRGSLALIYFTSAIYLIAILGFGLLISTISTNQLQAMFIAYFFIMIFVLMSGLFTSIESMPLWARNISAALPITHFMKAIRMIILKGSGLQDLLPILLKLGVFAFVLNGLAIWNYRKTF